MSFISLPFILTHLTLSYPLPWPPLPIFLTRPPSPIPPMPTQKKSGHVGQSGCLWALPGRTGRQKI